MKTPQTRSTTRTVLFLTAPNDPSIPHAAKSLACLLPMAWASFAERVMGTCAQAGIKDIDVVACDYPEQLRQMLGDGQRWGLRLTWQLVKDGSAPYGVIQQVAFGAERVIVGHAHCWIDQNALGELLLADRTAVVLEPAVRWTGWASMAASDAAQLSPYADADTLAQHMMAGPASRYFAVQPGQFLSAGSSQDLLEVQRACMESGTLQSAPSSWLHKPWGLLSPEARLSPQATIKGPVVIGPGCVVDEDAVIGPNAVLYRDVAVARGASVERSLVMTGTYVGANVSVIDTVAQGNMANHVGWGVQHELPLADAVLTPLRPEPDMSLTPAALAGRLVAGMVLLVGLPSWAVLCSANRLLGRPGKWKVRRVVRGWAPNGDLELMPTRVAPSEGSRVSALIGAYGAVLDVLQGRRSWFGVRARDAGSWYAMNRDWQRLLAQQPIGVFHALAWSDDGQAVTDESQAVADAFFAASRTRRERLAVIVGAISAWRSKGTRAA